jgi:hypothetical protein
LPVVHRLEDRWAIAVFPYLDGHCHPFGSFPPPLGDADLDVVVELQYLDDLDSTFRLFRRPRHRNPLHTAPVDRTRTPGRSAVELAGDAWADHSVPSQVETGGRRSAQGTACSSWPARESNVSSSPRRPTNWTPMGKPSPFQCNGSEIAGWPVTLKDGVKGT